MPTSTIRVRHADEDDAAAVAEIYSAGIAARTSTFETDPRTADDVLARMRSARPVHPTLVAEDTGSQVVLGAAWLSPYSARPAYDGVAEYSVYVAGSARGAGVGTLLMGALLQCAHDGGLHKVTSRVFVDNRPSRALMARLGFREVGVALRHARLDGEWKDVVVVERLVDVL